MKVRFFGRSGTANKGCWAFSVQVMKKEVQGLVYEWEVQETQAFKNHQISITKAPDKERVEYSLI